MKEVREVKWDGDLKVEGYLFRGIMQRFPNHFHDYYVIGFIEIGNRYLACKNKEYTIDAGDMILFNPKDNHTCAQVDDKTLDYRCINIKEEVMRNLIEEITGKSYLPVFTEPVIFHAQQVDLLRELHEMIMGESEGFRKEECFYLLMEQLVKGYSKPAKTDISRLENEIQRASKVMEENYTRLITLQELCEVTGLGKYALIRTFTKERGVTPYQYLESLRINKAKELLENGMEPLETAMQTGFADQSHFTKFFKNLIGLTPKQYKNIFDKDIECGTEGGINNGK